MSTPQLSAIEPLLDEATAAEILNCSTRTLQRKRAEGTGPEYFKDGNLVRYTPNGLRRHIAKNTRKVACG